MEIQDAKWNSKIKHIRSSEQQGEQTQGTLSATFIRLRKLYSFDEKVSVDSMVWRKIAVLES